MQIEPIKATTKATLKAFVKNNNASLMIKNHPNVAPSKKAFRKSKGMYDAKNCPMSLGISGIFLTKTKNIVTQHDTKSYIGYTVTNLCDTFTVAVKK